MAVKLSLLILLCSLVALLTNLPFLPTPLFGRDENLPVFRTGRNTLA